MKTKDKILIAAKDLFNQNGYTSTSTRDIAKYLKISPGNLHYHFTHSKQIVEALFNDFAKQMDVLLENVSQSESTTIDLLYNYIEETSTLFFSYKFLFINFSDILRESEVINKLYKEIHVKRKLEFQNLFLSLQEKKIFRLDIPSFIFSNLIEQMFITGDSILAYNEITHNFEGQKAVDYYTKILMIQFYYLLTDKSKKLLEDRIEVDLP